MSAVPCSVELEVDARARHSCGISDVAIYEMVARTLEQHQVRRDIVLDIGCGHGYLRPFLGSNFSRYIGADVVRYSEFPSTDEFTYVNLEKERVPLADDIADVVVCVETIEHLENPRSFMRELVRLAKVGGWVVVTTPNQLSLLSLLTLISKRRFSAFQDVHYPAHLTALLESDLVRMAAECKLTEVSIGYSYRGRLMLTPWHYPGFLARRFPRALSDNLLMIGRKS